jgi:hypothetical protein
MRIATAMPDDTHYTLRYTLFVCDCGRVGDQSIAPKVTSVGGLVVLALRSHIETRWQLGRLTLVFCFLAQLLAQSLELQRLLAFWASSGQLSVSGFDSAFDGLAAQPTALKKSL